MSVGRIHCKTPYCEVPSLACRTYMPMQAESQSYFVSIKNGPDELNRQAHRKFHASRKKLSALVFLEQLLRRIEFRHEAIDHFPRLLDFIIKK